MSIEVGVEAIGGMRQRCDHPNVAVGAHEVELVVAEVGAAGGLVESKNVEREAARRGARFELGGWRTVDVRLPIERSERGEVVGVALARGHDPGQTIAGEDRAGAALAPGAGAIFDPDLREGSEEDTTAERRPRDAGDEPRRDLTADDAGDVAVARRGLEDARSVVATRRRAKAIRSGS